ncbi:MAG: EAL domain-containing protein [Burkholderiales bacterium]|uniref:EAL domain-containing protein n=1 Tax=Inhella sp. TaxID=1921806 RepID=UPI001AD4ABBC|nr:EAL domain-containing protein [Burkholderiales bacterium]
MSLIRQVLLLIALALLLALTGGVLVAGGQLRELLSQQAAIKNADNAQALALAASQQGGDAALIELLMSAQFDTGHYQLLRWRKADGNIAFERVGAQQAGKAPPWLQQWVRIEAAPGVAQLSSGWQALGQVELATQLSYAYDALWASLLRVAAWTLVLALLALAAAWAVMSRIRRPLDDLARQADALAEGHFLQVQPSGVKELRPLSKALNGMVQRIEQLFAAHTAQLGLLREQAHCDALTGLFLRQHFLAELASALARDDGPSRASLLLIRLQDLAGVNRLLGREATDRALAQIGRALHPFADSHPGSLAGRLNGADFGLWLPETLTQTETESLREALHLALQGCAGEGGSGALHLALGGTEQSRSRPLSQWFALADQALAEAELRTGGDMAVVWRREEGEETSAALPQGEGAWRAQIEATLAQSRLRLLQYPVLDREGRLLHWECPLHLGLNLQGDGGAEFVSAMVWLPLAQRTGLSAEVDLAAVQAALQMTAADGQMRAVNLAPASLLAGDFLQRLRALLKSQPLAARQLALEFDVSAAQRQFALLAELSRAVHPLGVRLGLEHAGAQLQHIERLYQLGLDYVKLDRSVLLGVADDHGRASFVRSLVILLHGLSLQVMGEGVEQARDAQVLWDCGLAGVTGPWATTEAAATR